MRVAIVNLSTIRANGFDLTAERYCTTVEEMREAALAKLRLQQTKVAERIARIEQADDEQVRREYYACMGIV